MIPNQKPRVHSCAVRRKPPKPDDQLYFSTGQSKNSESGAPVFQFESSNKIQVDHDSRATATLETKTELSKDARAIRKRVLKHAEEDLKGKTLNTSDVKLDKGIHGYTDYKAGFRREQTVAGEKAGASNGPPRASAYVRATSRIDHQPDIYGDSCKFLLDR